jgi:hypothetical protein
MSYKYKLAVLLGFVIPLVAIADVSSNTETITPFSNSNQSVPLSKRGIQLVPLKLMSIPEAQKEEVLARALEQKEKGFYETDSEYAKFLLETPAHAANEIKSFKANNDPTDTHLKANFNEIKLAFSFKGLPSIKKNDIIGYAAIGGWHDGWTGIKVFFKQNKSVCSYSYFDLAASHGAAQLNQEYATKEVNGKISYIDIEGNRKSGMLYSVNWFEEKAVHQLDCANATYNKLFTDGTVALARQLDKDMSPAT